MLLSPPWVSKAAAPPALEPPPPPPAEAPEGLEEPAPSGLLACFGAAEVEGAVASSPVGVDAVEVEPPPQALRPAARAAAASRVAIHFETSLIFEGSHIAFTPAPCSC